MTPRHVVVALTPPTASRTSPELQMKALCGALSRVARRHAARLPAGTAGTLIRIALPVGSAVVVIDPACAPVLADAAFHADVAALPGARVRTVVAERAAERHVDGGRPPPSPADADDAG